MKKSAGVLPAVRVGVHVKKAARMHKISSSRQIPRASHPGFPEELQKTSTAVTTARINIAIASASMNQGIGLNCAKQDAGM